MIRKCGYFYVFVIIALTAGVDGNGNSGLSELYSKLLKSHNIIPPNSSNISVFVNVQLSNLLQLDIRNQQMSFTAIINLNWTDPSLAWNRKEFPQINRVTVPSDKIWTPDIVIWNSNSENMQGTGSDLSISADGHVHWPIFGYFETSCTIDVTYYPFDQQTCIIKLGSTDRSILIDTDKTSIDLDQFYMSVTWDVIEAPVYRNVYETHDVDFPVETDVTCYLIIRRKTLWMSEVYPFLALAFVTIIPAIVTRSLEKLILQVFCLAGLFALHMDLMNKLPPTALVTPLASKYIVSLTLYNLIHLALSAVINNRRGCLQWIAQQSSFKWMTKQVLKVKKSSGDKEDDETKQDIEKESSLFKQSEGQTTIVAVFNWIVLASLIAAVAISTLNFLLNHPH